LSKKFIYLIHLQSGKCLLLVIGYQKTTRTHIIYFFKWNISIKNVSGNAQKCLPQENILFCKLFCWYDWQCLKYIIFFFFHFLVYCVKCKCYIYWFWTQFKGRPTIKFSTISALKGYSHIFHTKHLNDIRTSFELLTWISYNLSKVFFFHFIFRLIRSFHSIYLNI